jgi:hypothetical protein
MSKYILGIKSSECENKDKLLCLQYQRYGRCRLDKMCKRVTMLNPLCFADTCKQMFPTKIDFVNVEGEEYLLYKCDKHCSHFLKINTEKFLKSLDRKDLVYGDDLSNLLKKININETVDTNPNTDLEYLKVLLIYMKGENVQ